MKKLPYEHTEKVQAIMNSDMPITEKADKIYQHDYDMACRMSDRAGVKASMSRNQIIDILVERER